MERKYCVLIVDDDSHIRTTYQDYLTQQGFEKLTLQKMVSKDLKSFNKMNLTLHLSISICLK
jgi:DNA-binding response OmpR family regulator